MPNQAMPWRKMMYCYLGISLVTLAVGIGFYIVGLKLVLPFAGIEILALGAALYCSAWRSHAREVITIAQDCISVERGHLRPLEKSEFSRAWSKVILVKPRFYWHPSRLYIRSHGRQLEIGAFLNEQERQGLAQELARELRRH